MGGHPFYERNIGVSVVSKKYKPLSDNRVLELSGKVLARFRGHYPPGWSRRDTENAIVALICELQYEHSARAPDVNFDAWIITRTWGDLSDRFAREYRHYRDHQGLDALGPRVAVEQDEAKQAADTALDVQSAIDKLPPAQARVIRLQMRGMTQTEIAKEVGVAQPYVQRLLKFARVALAEHLGAYSDDDDNP